MEGHFDGKLQAQGGYGYREFGAAGTVFIEKSSNSTYRGFRTLRVDNNKKQIETGRINQVVKARFCLS